MSSANRTVRFEDPNAEAEVDYVVSKKKAAATPRSTTKRTSVGERPKTPTEDGNLIVARGLQEILDKEEKKRKSEQRREAKKAKTGGGPGSAPNFVFCYLCGRQFGKASIGFHRPQCYLKKMIEWERGNPSTRGPKPVDPETHDKQIKARMQEDPSFGTGGAGAGGRAGGGGFRGNNRRAVNDLERFNQAEMEAYNTTALAPCPNCGRTFLPDRLEVHLRSCKPGAAAKPVRPGQRLQRGGGPAAAAASAAGGGAEDQPIRASGAYKLGDDAGPESMPAGGSGGASKKANRFQPPPASNPEEERPVKASGAYVIPDTAAEDSVPPVTTAAGSSAGAGKTNGVGSRRTSGAAAHPPRRLSAALEEHKPNSDSDSDGDDGDSEGGGEGEEVVLVMDDDSPTTNTSATPQAAEQRLSAPLDDDDEVVGASAPNRHASMDAGNSTSSAHLLHRRASGSAGRMQPGGDDDDDAEEEEMPHAQGAGASRPAVVNRPMSEPRAGLALPLATGEEDDDDGDAAGLGNSGSQKRIQFNNVSRFKNVQSRLKVERQAQSANLVPCQFCGRTFNPLRVEKHESVCLERNKAPPPTAPANSAAKKKPARAPRKSAPNVSAAALSSSGRMSGSGSLATTPRGSPVLFCAQCGYKLPKAGLKFCAGCGSKVIGA